MEKIFNEIINERGRQHKKFGYQNHTPIKWVAILGEELGEANQCLVDAHFGYKKREDTLIDFRKELIQVAAVGHQMIEVLYRGLKRPMPDFLCEEDRQHFEHGMILSREIGLKGDDLMFMWMGLLSVEFGAIGKAAIDLIEHPGDIQHMGMYFATLRMLITNCISAVAKLDEQITSEIVLPKID